MAMKKRAFAADFGAGNTCIYFIDINAPVRACTALTDFHGEPSGYAIHANGGVPLGRRLYGLQYSDLAHIKEFHINLKRVPTEENRAELTKYFKLWLTNLRTYHPAEFQNVEEHWFIACPTGKEWKRKSVRELYKKIFEDAGFQNVTIVPESNGALAYFAYTRQILKDLKPSQKLLLIDLGAYSIDATPYFGDALGTSYGKYLGASLIDRMILRAILYFDGQRFRVGNRIINLPAVIDAARAKCKDEKFLTYMLLQARKLKEDFFTKEQVNQLPPQNLPLTTDFSVKVGRDDEYLTLFVNPKMMHLLMEQMTIKGVLGEEFNTLPPEVREYVGDLTWMGTLRKFFNELRAEYNLAADGSDAVIMLTGGGSLMKCISDEVKNQFPGATIHYDPEAISAIGQGIAYWAPDKLKALEFEKKYREDFLQRYDQDHISNQFNASFKRCVDKAGDSLAAEERNAFNDGIRGWRQYEYNSTDIPEKMDDHFRSWSNEEGVPTFSSDVQSIIGDLRASLNADFKTYVLIPLGMATGNPNDDTLLPAGDVFLPESKHLLNAMFDFWIDALIGYYKIHPNWVKFNNETKTKIIITISDPRQGYYDANSDGLDNWIAGETGATTNLCQQYFCEWRLALESSLKDLDGSEQFVKAQQQNDLCSRYFGDHSGYLAVRNNPTLMDHYRDEGWKTLEELMEKRKREILGKLVLEEMLED